MSLLSDADCGRIQEAVRALEKKSSTELVVAVVPKSADYWQMRLVVAVAWSLAAALALVHFRPELDPSWVLLLEVPVGLVTFLLFGQGPLARLLIPKAASREAVERRAFELFSARGLHATRDRTGMLILVSELEHRVVILGDRAIHERVGTAGWQAHVDHIVAAIHRGDAVSGILEVVERLDRAHAELLPVGAGDTNELPDDIVRG
jgi:putative membrane protein